MNKYKRIFKGVLLLGIFIIIFIGIIGILLKWDNYVLNKKSILHDIPTDTYLVCILNYTVIQDEKKDQLQFVEEHSNYETKAILYISKSGLINLKFYDYNIRKTIYDESPMTAVIKDSQVYVYKKGKYIQNKYFKTLIKKTADHSYQVISLSEDKKDYIGMGFTCK